MSNGLFTKDPQAVLDYFIDWSEWLEPINDTIATSSWAVSGITISNQTNTATIAYVWLAGGAQGVYRVTNTIETTGGRRDERSLTIRIQNR